MPIFSIYKRGNVIKQITNRPIRGAMAEWLERWLPNYKVSSSNLSDRKILESFEKIHTRKIIFW